MKWMEPFYTGDIEPDKIEEMKAEAKSADIKQFGGNCLIILPANPANMFEIMSFHQLAIPYYQQKDIKVVGFAKDKDDATAVVGRIVEDMLKQNCDFKVSEFFK